MLISAESRNVKISVALFQLKLEGDNVVTLLICVVIFQELKNIGKILNGVGMQGLCKGKCKYNLANHF